MAEYGFQSVFLYTQVGASSNVQLNGATNETGTLTGGGADSISPGNPVSDDGGFVGLYYGQYTGGSGEPYLIVQVNSTTYNVYSAQTVEEVGNDLPTIVKTGTDIDTQDPFIVCFAAGTLIGVPGGEKRVEDLRIGDLIKTAGNATVAVKWIGRRKMMKLFTPADRLRPVRVRRGALGNGLPHTDLLLTADHALILDGLAINASALVNGSSITFEPLDSLPDQFTYYHVETEGHEVILANGAPAETYIDYVARSAFNNYAEYLELYGEDKVITEMAIPRISASRMVPECVRARLAEVKAA